MIKKNKQKYELLSPAGSIEKARYALEFGADAIYLGIPDFSLRARINKFTEKDIQEIIKYAHERNKKVYITVNIFVHNRHLKPLPKFLKKVNLWQADGIIISDPGVIILAKKHCPNVPIHLSTQANCTNYESAKFWFEQGVERIILAREVSLEEIKEIHKKIPKLELEYFVHGAMCMSYSGRCLLSSYFTGKSANLGDCTQPCRWKYDTLIKADGHDDKVMNMEEDKHGSYILNSKDLCLVKYLDELKDAGIISFKIEGRAKSIYYASLVSLIYRQALDLRLTNEKLNKLYKELESLVHRGYTTGFLFGKEKVEQKYSSSHIMPKHQFVGEITKSVKSIKLKIESQKWSTHIKVHNAILVGDDIEIIEPSGVKTKIKIKKMYEQDEQEIQEAHGGQGKTIILHTKNKIQKMAVVRKSVLANFPI